MKCSQPQASRKYEDTILIKLEYIFRDPRFWLAKEKFKSYFKSWQTIEKLSDMSPFFKEFTLDEEVEWKSTRISWYKWRAQNNLAHSTRRERESKVWGGIMRWFGQNAVTVSAVVDVIKILLKEI